MNILLVALMIIVGGYVEASEFEVGKVSKSGRKAVIYIPKGGSLKKGQKLTLISTSKLQTSVATGSERRLISIGGRGALSSRETEVKDNSGNTVNSEDTNTMSLELSGYYNKARYELGGTLGFSKDSTKTLNQQRYSLGAFAEYNFALNKSGVKLVPHAGLELGFGSSSNEDSQSNKSDGSGIYYGLYGGLKYFMFPGSGFALTADLYYRIDESYSIDPNTTSITEMGVKLGVRYYF